MASKNVGCGKPYIQLWYGWGWYPDKGFRRTVWDYAGKCGARFNRHIHLCDDCAIRLGLKW